MAQAYKVVIGFKKSTKVMGQRPQFKRYLTLSYFKGEAYARESALLRALQVILTGGEAMVFTRPAKVKGKGAWTLLKKGRR